MGVRPGDRVLSNAFTLAPVPGAIAAVGGVPVFVEVTEDLVLDLDHLGSDPRARLAELRAQGIERIIVCYAFARRDDEHGRARF